MSPIFKDIRGQRPPAIRPGSGSLARLLETTDKLVSDIAQEVGFHDQSHMTRAFKTIRNSTPGEYRRKHRSITANNSSAPKRKF